MLTIKELVTTAETVAKEYNIKSIMLFGSYANGTQTSASDVDLLIEFFVPTVSLFTLAEIKDKLETLLNTDVDVIHGPLPENSMIKTNKVVTLYAA